MNEETHIPMKYFAAVAIAPVLIFALAIALFLPLIGALEISRGGFLAELISSSRNPFVQDFILIFAGFCCLPFSVIVALAHPPPFFEMLLELPPFGGQLRNLAVKKEQE